jgi:inorganic phosphate transporter, PiT family
MNFRLLAALFMGWSLGSNDAANIFGTAVSSFMVKYRTAVVLTAVFVILGALAGGLPGIKTLSGITSQNLNTAFYVSIAAGFTITLMTLFNIPASASQAVIGGILGVGILQREINLAPLLKVFACWVGTPLGGMLIAIILYFLLSSVIRRLNLHFMFYDKMMRILLISAGAYGAYALGANNVANVTGVFYKAGTLSAFHALLLGGVSIGLGAVTYSRRVMMTVGRKMVKLDAFSAFIAVLAGAVTVHIYAKIGVPVSSAQAIVGAVIGIGLSHGVKTVQKKTVFKIVAGWFFTPVIAGLFSVSFYYFFYRS